MSLEINVPKIKATDANGYEIIIEVESDLADALEAFLTEEGQQIVTEELDKELIESLRATAKIR